MGDQRDGIQKSLKERSGEIRMNQDKKTIRTMFEQFTTAWHSRETDVLDQLLLPDCHIDFSIFKKGITRDELKKELAVRTRNQTYSRFEVFNFVCCIGEDKAQQSATIGGIFVDESGERPDSFGFTAKMSNTLVKTENGWRYSAMRLDLAGESDNHGKLRTTGIGVMLMNGDTSFVENWNLIPNEVGWHEGSRMFSVVPEVDAPWYAIKDRIDVDTDEEQITETIYRYCYALDFDCIELYDGVFSKNAHVVYNDNRMYDKRTASEMLRFEREGGIGSHHVLYPYSIDVQGDLAYVRAYRSGMDYIPAEVLVGEKKHQNWLAGRYNLVFTKEDGVWRILRLNYYQGGQVGPRSPEVFYCTSGN